MTNVNIIEEFRKVNVKHCFSLSSFESTWPAWKNEIQSILNNEITTDTIIGLGNSLRDIFFFNKHRKKSKFTIKWGKNMGVFGLLVFKFMSY